MANNADLVTVGKITSVYGVKGWVKIFSWTEPKENIFNYQPWFLGEVGQEQPEAATCEIEADEFRKQGKGLVAHLKGVEDRDEARQYCQREILIDASQLPQPEQGQYYWYQLQGLKVLTNWQIGEDSKGSNKGEPELLGVISDMMATGANDVMVVDPCDGSLDDRQRLIPFLPGAYNTEIDLDEGKVSLDWDSDF